MKFEQYKYFDKELTNIKHILDTWNNTGEPKYYQEYREAVNKMYRNTTPMIITSEKDVRCYGGLQISYYKAYDGVIKLFEYNALTKSEVINILDILNFKKRRKKYDL